MHTIDKAAIRTARDIRYRRRMDLRVTDQIQAREFVVAAGFCFLFPIQDFEMPSLWDAVAGRVVKPTNKHSGYEIERTWGWKDESLGKKWWFYGKLIRSRSTLVSMDYLPNFYALSENYGEYTSDYLDEYREGRLSAEAKAIYESLLRHGPLDAIRLRREARLSSEAAKGRFERALTDLQVGLKVLPVGIAEAGAWRYAFIYEVLPRWLPPVPARAGHIRREAARQAILERYVANVVATTPRQVARLFGWSLADTQRAAEALAAGGKIQLGVKVAGVGELQWVSSAMPVG